MSTKNCATCVFYELPQGGNTCGTCEYPVPEYLKTGTSGGNFISSADYTGINCATYKSRLDLVGETLDQ